MIAAPEVLMITMEAIPDSKHPDIAGQYNQEYTDDGKMYYKHQYENIIIFQLRNIWRVNKFADGKIIHLHSQSKSMSSKEKWAIL